LQSGCTRLTILGGDLKLHFSNVFSRTSVGPVRALRGQLLPVGGQWEVGRERDFAYDTPRVIEVLCAKFQPWGLPGSAVMEEQTDKQTESVLYIPV
jgi:hypothetical protein